MTVYYNEFDEDAAAILQVLIDEKLIAHGEIDTRSIEDVTPSDLRGFTQHHFFAGIGVWSLALRRCGWPDDRAIWTGSCPCQPFSAAGKGAGFDDERHLWPAFYHLISQCRPPVILGEQVASKPVDDWIDLVQVDVEAVGYAFGCVPFPSAGVGAPHIRDRAYWVADADQEQRRWGPDSQMLAHGATRGWQQGHGEPEPDCAAFGLGHHHHHQGLERHAGHDGAAGRQGQAGPVATASLSGRVADADCQRHNSLDTLLHRDESGRHAQDRLEVAGNCEVGRPGPTNGLWAAADWLLCRDGKWRPVEPSTFPLAPAGSFRNRVAALRGAGNAINLQAACAFIEACF